MSAAEIIELIKQLPPEEKAAVVAFLRNDGEEKELRVEEAAVERKVRYASDEEFEKVLPEIFAKHEELFRRLAQ